MLPVYALFSIVTVVAVVGLGVVSLLGARHERAAFTFALFCFSWTAFAFAVARLQLLEPRAFAAFALAAPSAEALSPLEPLGMVTRRWAHVPPAFAFVTGFFAMIHVLALTGRDDRLDERLGPIRIRHYVILFAGLTVAGALLSLGTELVVAGASFDPWLGYGVRFAPSALLIQLPFAIAAGAWLVLLTRAEREAEDVAGRELLRRSRLGFAALLLGAMLVTIVPTVLGLATPGIAADLGVVVAVYLMVALGRHRTGRLEARARRSEEALELRTRELARARERVLDAEKMASHGALVAGVAQEMNAPLGAVRKMHDTRARAADRLMQRVQELLGAQASNDKTLVRSRAVLLQGDQVIRDGIENIERIVGQLKTLAKRDQEQLESVDLNCELDDTLALLSPRLQQVRVVRRYGEIPPITCVARQIDQVLLSVLTNAVEAVSESGRRTGTVGIHTAREGEFVAVRITDDGVGIAGEDLPRIFEPGYTSKGPGVGLGLGLAICYQLVHEHGGEIGVESCPGVGTKVRIALPIEARLIVRSAGSSPLATEHAPETPLGRPRRA